MGIILTMSFMGSFLLILYWLICPLVKRYFTSMWRYFLLKVCILYFLVPFPLVREYFWKFWRILLGNKNFALREFEYVNLNNAVKITLEGETIRSKFYYFLVIGIVIWTIIVFLMFLKQFISYRKLNKSIAYYSRELVDDKINCILEQKKDELYLRRKIEIQESKYINTPLMIGFIHPKVIVPEKLDISLEKIGLILNHEMVHIKHNDYFIRILVLLVIILHWYNPLSYLLFKEVIKVSEIACDEVVALNLNKQQRIVYGNIILDMSSEDLFNKHIATSPISYFGSNNRMLMKERLSMLKQVKPMGKQKLILSVIIMTKIILFSSFTVFAYKEQSVVENVNIIKNEEVNLENTTSYFVANNENQETTESIINFENEVEKYFKDKDNNVYEISQERNETKIICSHIYQDGDYIEHEKRSDGGCKETYYEAQFCKKCGRCIVGDSYKTITNKKCPH